MWWFGRRSLRNRRLVFLICYFFYKNIAFGLTLFYFEAFTDFFGQSVYDDWYMLLFNVVLTSLPVISLGVFEHDVSSEVFLQPSKETFQGALLEDSYISPQEALQLTFKSHFCPSGLYMESDVFRSFYWRSKKLFWQDVNSLHSESTVLLFSLRLCQLGANAILAVSLAVCKAGASVNKIPLYKHIAILAGNKTLVLHVPAFNVIGGGSHACNKLAMREFMILHVFTCFSVYIGFLGCIVSIQELHFFGSTHLVE